eukprot:TRINITY_DN3342_c0_g2_i3.p1 TRINITY_DN3342_c0_g2~~TRINITY_DN3342_c0_g2_i3.p1  ORF type:complete len:321 (+),score=73.17 TRINITY_DN3342_c0_g2_i3:836-1798(+)
MTKIDIIKPDSLAPENQKLITEISADQSVLLLTLSTVSEEGVIEVKKAACESLLDQRSKIKLKSSRINDISNRMHLAVPVPRDNVERPPQIPESVGKPSNNVFSTRQKEWEEQQALYQEMEAVVSTQSTGEQIEREELIRLRALEDEMMEEAVKNSQFELTDDQKEKLRMIRQKRAELILRSRQRKSNRSETLPRTSLYEKTYSELEEHLSELGLDGKAVTDSIKSRSKSRSSVSRARSVSASRVGRKRTREEIERSKTPKPGEGYRNVKQKLEAEKLARRATRSLSRDGRLGESDRHVFDLKPKHLFSGKSTVGKRAYR